MPTYEYECQECGYVFEKYQGIRDKSLKECPKCRGKIQRLIGRGSSIIVKDSGGYATDYATRHSPACGQDRPCCGRDTPCDSKPCES